MKWVCSICGKAIESDSKPIACPLCGANGDYIVLEADFKGFPEKVEPKTKEHLNAALELETNATRDYFNYAKECEEIGDVQAAEVFTALARVEAGHKQSLRKMLGIKI
jgi:rubrerythrin